MIGDAFSPQGNTAAIVSAASSTTAIQVTNAQSSTGGGPAYYRFSNVGAVPMFINWGATSSVAAAVIPTGGSPSAGICIPAGSSVVLKLIPCAWFTTIASATTSILYITPGDGGS